MLKDAVEKLHNCKARHRNTVRVQEKFRVEIVRDGMVEVFELADANPAARCYAWQHSEDDADTRTRVVTVLEKTPANSLQTAVKVAIVDEYKRLGYPLSYYERYGLCFDPPWMIWS